MTSFTNLPSLKLQGILCGSRGCVRSKMEVIGNTLAATIAPAITKRAEVTAGILELWPAILPRHLSETCKPVMLVDGVLTVECLSPSYAFDLRCESPCILARLRQSFGNKVRRLYIVLEGHVA